MIRLPVSGCRQPDAHASPRRGAAQIWPELSVTVAVNSDCWTRTWPCRGLDCTDLRHQSCHWWSANIYESKSFRKRSTLLGPNTGLRRKSAGSAASCERPS